MKFIMPNDKTVEDNIRSIVNLKYMTSIEIYTQKLHNQSAFYYIKFKFINEDNSQWCYKNMKDRDADYTRISKFLQKYE